MEIIPVSEKMSEFVAEQAPRFDLGGYSNLKKADLNKSSRLGFQFTGLFGETAWYMYRHGSFKRLKELLDFKFNHYTNTGKGDDGQDDTLIYNGKQRLVDIKSTHITDISQIRSLNLVIPPRELHSNMIYVAAYTVGPEKTNREKVDKVVLAGWCLNEDVKERWGYDPAKFAVKVRDLNPMDTLRQMEAAQAAQTL